MSFLLAEREARAEAATTTAQRRVLAVALLITLLLTCAALTGCGGGDPEDNPLPEADAVKTTQPLNCVAHPEACK